jgi:hypothetical protein
MCLKTTMLDPCVVKYTLVSWSNGAVPLYLNVITQKLSLLFHCLKGSKVGWSNTARVVTRQFTLTVPKCAFDLVCLFDKFSHVITCYLRLLDKGMVEKTEETVLR